MTVEQEKKIENWFIKIWKNQADLEAQIRQLREDLVQPTLDQAKHNGVLAVEVREAVEKVQARLSRLAQKVGQ
jgi:hypothetical protein